MDISIYKVDAFTPRLFGGNPAAICLLSNWPADDLLQAIASENNLPATAYLVGEGNRFHLRWFTPRCEIDLCGHATLASGHVLFNELGVQGDVVRFETKSGELMVTSDDGFLTMDFPSRPPAPVDEDPSLAAALGGPEPAEILAARDYLVRYRSPEEVRELSPDMEALKKIDRFGFIVTARGNDCDFVSRFFAPAKGIPEDAVTGSAHCTLTPYWAGQLGKSKLRARQLSQRTGELFCELAGERVRLSGTAVLFSKGQIRI